MQPPRRCRMGAAMTTVRGVAVMTALLGGVTAIVASPLDRQTTAGMVRGMAHSAGVSAWYGVRYGQPPVGSLRWRPPLPIEPWNGTVAATQHMDCYQVAGDAPFLRTLGTEAGCLTVDIWAPAAARPAPNGSALPVMLWIHGGGFTDASPSFDVYNATRLVAQSAEQGTPVIVVALTYRLGGLGFMGLPALATEPGAHGSSGNYGMLDQVLAMQWVQRNIGNWGGDPSRVTLFGESAGAYSICTHLASPLSRGLFAAAILESAYCGIAYIYNSVSASVGQACQEFHGCSAGNVTCMRALNVSSAYNCQFRPLARAGLLSVATPGGSDYLSQVVPNIDGYFLTEPPIDGIRRGNTVPVLVGSNFRELMVFAMQPATENIWPWNMTESELRVRAGALINGMAYRRWSRGHSPPTFVTEADVDSFVGMYNQARLSSYARGVSPLFGELCELFRGRPGMPQYPPSPCNFTTSSAVYVAMASDIFMTYTAESIADAVVASGQPAYRYLFNGSFAPTNPLSNYTAVGAFHSLDVPFVFDTFSQYGSLFRVSWAPGPSSPTTMLGSAMQAYWINFAVYGSPNGLGTGPAVNLWPRWAPGSTAGAAPGQYMHLVEPGLGASSGFRTAVVETLGQLSETGSAVSAANATEAMTIPPLQQVSLTLNATTGWLYVNGENHSITGVGRLVQDPQNRAVYASLATSTGAEVVSEGVVLTPAGTRRFINILHANQTRVNTTYLVGQPITDPFDSDFCEFINPMPCSWESVERYWAAFEWVGVVQVKGLYCQNFQQTYSYGGSSDLVVNRTVQLAFYPNGTLARLNHTEYRPEGVITHSMDYTQDIEYTVDPSIFGESAAGPLGTKELLDASILAGDPTSIASHYSSTATLIVFNVATSSSQVYSGTAQIAHFWAQFLEVVNPSECQTEPVLSQLEAAAFFDAAVCQPCGLVSRSNSVILNTTSASTVQMQGVVLDWPGVNVTSWTSSSPSAVPCRGSAATVAPASMPPAVPTQPSESVIAALDEHSRHIHNRDAAQIAAQYASDAVLTVFNIATQTSRVYRGRTEVETFWTDLLSVFDLAQCGSDVFVASILTDSFFLAWPCFSCGVTMGSDSVLLNASKAYAFQVHNVVFDWSGLDVSSWTADAVNTPCRGVTTRAPTTLTPAPSVVSRTAAPVQVSTPTAAPTQRPQPIAASNSKLTAGDGAGIAIGVIVVLAVAGLAVAYARGAGSGPRYTGLAPAHHTGRRTESLENPTYEYASA